MIIDAISDLHGKLPTLFGGNLLVVAGDITAYDKPSQWEKFFDWLKAQPYDRKIFVAGNHDGNAENFIDTPVLGYEYLCDTGTEFQGLKIWGSPWTPTFCDWYFMKDRNKMHEAWDLVPQDTDILITHGPPRGILDLTGRPFNSFNEVPMHVGCDSLRKFVDKAKPGLNIFGHIHEGYGTLQTEDTLFVNASLMDERYNFVNPPTRILYENNKFTKLDTYETIREDKN